MERIEKYRILEELGQGGMSVVYRGHDEALDRHVAVKVMHKHLARDPDARERFAREARAVAKLTHHNIPEIYDFSSVEGELNYLVTELVEGHSMATLVQRHPAMLPEIGAMLAVGVADALTHAHEHSIIHRDVKPENILVGRDGVVKLTDFGIAQIVGLESMTITGALVGSPAHMSPEQIEGRGTLDFRTDVWALGTVLYVVATGGTLPFSSTTPHAVLKRILDGRYEDPRRRNPHIDSRLGAIIDRCLRVEPEARYASTELLAADLKQWLAERGLHDIDQEIAAWMAAPDSYQAQLSERLVGLFMVLGDEATSKNDRHVALEHFGRVLQLDPDHPEAAERVRLVSSRLRRRKLMMASAGIVVAVMAALTLTWALWPTRLPSVPAADGLALSVTPTPPELTASVAVPERDVVEPEPDIVVPPTTAGVLVGELLGPIAIAGAARAAAQADPPPPKAIEVRIINKRVAFRSVVDGKYEIKAGGATLQLSPGKHKAVTTHTNCPLASGCPPYHQTFRVRSTKPTQRTTLEYRYGFFEVKLRCTGGTVYLRGRKLGRCDATHKVPVFSNKQEQRTLTVKFANGSKKTRQIIFKPGGQAAFSITP